MLIKDCLERVSEKEQIKVVVFEGNKESFYAWFEYTSKKEVPYLFKLEFNYDALSEQTTIHLVLDSLKKEYSAVVDKILGAIQHHYKTQLGITLSLSVEKTYRKKEVLLDLLSLRK